MIDLAEIEAAVHGEVTRRRAARFHDVSIDGRTVKPCELYVAIVGERFDGHDFCAQAIAAGAAGLIVGRRRTPGGLDCTVIEVDDTRLALGQIARAVRRRSGVQVVGITGSSGKTTTAALTAAALTGATGGAAAAAVLVTRGSFNNETGVPLTLLRLAATHRFAVVEMGMRYVGNIGYLVGLAEPDVGVVVNAGVAHLGIAGSVERIARGKSEMFLGAGWVVFPAEDPRLAALADERGIAPERRLTFGPAPGATIRVLATTPVGLGAQRVQLETPIGTLEAQVPLPGGHNAQNAACALAVAHALGLPLVAAAAGLAAAEVPEHRSALVEIGGRHVLDDCYNANPASMRAAVDTLAQLAPSARAVAVVGDMLELGPAEVDEHRSLGRLLAIRGVAHVAVLGAQAQHVAAGLAAAGGPAPLLSDDPAAVAAAVARWTRPGDVVLIKGSRGMRLERVLDELRKALN